LNSGPPEPHLLGSVAADSGMRRVLPPHRPLTRSRIRNELLTLKSITLVEVLNSSSMVEDGRARTLSVVAQIDGPLLVDNVAETDRRSVSLGEELGSIVDDVRKNLEPQRHVEGPGFEGVFVEGDLGVEAVAKPHREGPAIRLGEPLLEPQPMGQHPTPQHTEAIWPKGGALLPQPKFEEVVDLRPEGVVQAGSDRDAKPLAQVVGPAALDVELVPFPEEFLLGKQLVVTQRAEDTGLFSDLVLMLVGQPQLRWFVFALAVRREGHRENQQDAP